MLTTHHSPPHPASSFKHLAVRNNQIPAIDTFAMAKVLFVLGLVAAALWTAEATRPGDSLPCIVPVKLEVDVNNKCDNIDVELSIELSPGKMHKPVRCRNHRLTTVGPVEVKVSVYELLSCEVSLLNKKGKHVKAKLSLHLLELAHSIAGVKHLALDLVEDLAEGVVRILCGPVLIAKIKTVGIA